MTVGQSQQPPTHRYKLQLASQLSSDAVAWHDRPECEQACKCDRCSRVSIRNTPTTSGFRAPPECACAPRGYAHVVGMLAQREAYQSRQSCQRVRQARCRRASSTRYGQIQTRVRLQGRSHRTRHALLSSVAARPLYRRRHSLQWLHGLLQTYAAGWILVIPRRY